MNTKDDKELIRMMDIAISEAQEIIKKLVDNVINNCDKREIVNTLIRIDAKLEMEVEKDKQLNKNKFEIGSYVDVQLPDRFGWFFGSIVKRHYGNLFDCMLIAGPERYGQIVTDIPENQLRGNNEYSRTKSVFKNL
jgi:hypothetical protein